MSGSPLFNADLVDDLARQRVVLFVGAGVSASTVTRTGARIKGWGEFLSYTCELVAPPSQGVIRELLDRGDLLVACELLQQELHNQWEHLIVDEYGQSAEPSPLHEALIALDQRIILTTNFDKLIEMHWDNVRSQSTHFPRVISTIDPSVFVLLKDHSSKFLVKIHGSVDDPSTLVFSRSEYIRSAFGNTAYSGLIEALLLNYTFLFVGFSMDDPALYSLMEQYTLRYPKVRPHYIFIPSTTSPMVIDLNRRLRKLLAIPYDASDGHTALPGVINSLAEQMSARRRDLVATGVSNLALLRNVDGAP